MCFLTSFVRSLCTCFFTSTYPSESPCTLNFQGSLATPLFFSLKCLDLISNVFRGVFLSPYGGLWQCLLTLTYPLWLVMSWTHHQVAPNPVLNCGYSTWTRLLHPPFLSSSWEMEDGRLCTKKTGWGYLNAAYVVAIFYAPSERGNRNSTRTQEREPNLNDEATACTEKATHTLGHR